MPAANKPPGASEFVDSVSVSADEEIRALKSEVKNLSRRLRARQGGEDLILKAVERAFTEPPDLSIPKAPPRGRRKAREIALLHVTDTQLGKRTGSYSISVAETRLLSLVERSIAIAETRRASASIDQIDLLLGGDMVEGEAIYPGQAHEIEQAVIDQAIKTAPAIFARMVLRLLEAFPRVRVYGVTGNHGRVAPASVGISKKSNWDRIAYEVARLMLLGPAAGKLGDRLEFHVAESWYSAHKVFDWGCLLIHGDQIRGGFAGFPWYGVAKKAWGWIDAIPEPWDYLYLGHWHQFASAMINHRTFFASGTPESGNVYAQEQLAAAGWPCQRLQFFTEGAGVVSDHQIFLDDGTRTPQALRRA